ncbi:glycoside hydrolase family 2 TIM barrel-domain containing protein [Salegentibacter sp. F188]|uniref:Glycoside hydrolase family 2 TIM barrel-domain containing protein n=1 Tax=Autumnicola patrickiae TaxID=3075591 RepID=A0ABU3E1W6_9FLAO|nr:sugar-binding domain-containing protein [Salegentibacter sp. F188]MDT0689993.1 glycoside hydrolase family 2 TIM barrel-domain containing protein [Salegentibacter sp. F188]
MNRYKLQVFLLVCFLIWTTNLFAQQKGKELFNDNWQFHLGDSISLNGQEWRNVDLPHDWSIEGPFDAKWASGTGFLPGGTGWYKKEFDLSDYDKDQQYAIYFDGVYKNSEVWINGHFLGKRPNGFISFQYDLTPYLRKEGNVLLVKAEHTDYADSRYYTGSGIYRNVYLLKQDPTHFSQWGVFFQTPDVSEEKATAKIAVEVDNHNEQNQNSYITVLLKDPSGNTVAEIEKQLTLRPGKENYAELKVEILDPELWSPDSPYLYDLEVTVLRNDQAVDTWKEKVGFRNFRFDANKGFFLNGENMLIKGVCIHHDAGALGAAVPKEVWRERFETIKKLGANAVRMSHYPHQDYIYELADEMGFLVQDEAFDEWEFGKNKWITGWNVGEPGNEGYHTDFDEWGQRDVEDMIRRNRNRPSIFMWSVGNEIDYPNDPYSHPVLDEGRNPQIYGKGYQPQNPPVEHLGKLANELVKAAKSYDTTRPVTAALAGVTMSNFTDYPGALDIVGYNYQEFRYEEDHKAFPNRVIYGSENGDALDAWYAVTENDFISSQFLWTAFDFMGEAREWPNRSSGAGIIDLAGKPKPDFYFRKSLWSAEPMIYIGITNSENNVLHRRNIQEAWIGDKGETKWVTVYTNTDEAELFLNGKSLGRKTAVYSNEKMISWEVPYNAGKLRALGFEDGKQVAEYEVETFGKVSKLEVTTTKASFSEEGEIVILDVLLTDRKGNEVTNQDRMISFQVEGQAKILALESGDRDSHEKYQAPQRKTYKGKLRAYIKTMKGEDDLIIKVIDRELGTKKIKIKNLNK